MGATEDLRVLTKYEIRLERGSLSTPLDWASSLAIDNTWRRMLALI